MQWEYARLVEWLTVDTTANTRNWIYKFYGPSDETTLQGKSSVEVLNRLGQDGWEALAIEPRYQLDGVSGTGTPAGIWSYRATLDRRTVWLKRPVNIGTS